MSELEAVAFPAGSMGPKVAAVCQFVRATGRRAAIGSLENVAAVFDPLRAQPGSALIVYIDYKPIAPFVDLSAA